MIGLVMDSFFFERTTRFHLSFLEIPVNHVLTKAPNRPPHYIYLTQCIPPTLCLLRIRHLPNVAPWISLSRHLPLVSRSTFCGLSIPICCGSDTAPDYFTPCIHIILNLLKPFETVTYLDITSSFPNVSYDTWDHFRFLMLSLRIFYFFWS